MYCTCNASALVCGLARRLCWASNICTLNIKGAVFACVHFFPSGYHASWRQRATWNRSGPMETDLWRRALTYECFLMPVHLLVCTTVFSWGVSYATFVNAPDGLATYWAHALLITLQGTREETTLRAHTSVVLLYACCWSCIGTLFECIWRATPQPCLRVVHTGYVLPVAYVCYTFEEPLLHVCNFLLSQ